MVEAGYKLSVTYRSAEELEALAPAQGKVNIGSIERPLPAQLACVCHDWNVGGVLPDWAHIHRTDPETYLDALMPRRRK